MNMKLNSIFGLVTLFPIWAFRGNLSYWELFLTIVIFFVAPFTVHLYLCYAFKKKTNSFNLYIIVYFSLLIVFCLDQNLGLWNTSLKFMGIFSPIVDMRSHSQYTIASIFLLIVLLFTVLALKIMKKNGFTIIFVFILSITLFNLFDYRKNISSFPSIENRTKKSISTEKTKDLKNFFLVIILDEMSGINSYDSDHYSGTIAANKLIKTFRDNDFEVFVNAKTLYNGTKRSIPSIVNYITSKEEYANLNLNKPGNRRFLLLKKSNNYFITHELLENKFFDNSEFSKISVFQSMFVNFCKHKKVIKCNQYNPFNKDQTFLKGFRNSYLTLIISVFKNNSSIIGNTFWRITRHLNLADSLLDPEGEKASFEYILNQIFLSISSKEIDLVFAHILVPHVPYGFDNNCNYDGYRGVRYNSMSIDDKRSQHNLERNCVAIFFDVFFEKLKKKKVWEDLEITILSDHDSRISEKDIPHTAVFAHKSLKNKSKLNYDSKTTNQIFKKLFIGESN